MISGKNFAPAEKVAVVMLKAVDGKDLTLVTQVTADAKGSFSIEMDTAILSPVLPGTYTVRATGSEKTTAEFSWKKEK